MFEIQMYEMLDDLITMLHQRYSVMSRERL